MQFTAQQIREKYDQIAPRYDRLEAFGEWLGLSRLRRHLLQKAHGDVLEVAAGTGKNLPFYPKGCRLTAVDLSSGMLAIARQRAERLGLQVDFHVMDVEALSFPDRSFDTVVSTMSLCTYSDPVAALREMARVCRPEGRILLLEHGRSNREWLGRWQDRNAERHAALVACQWNREPLELVHQAGLSVVSARRTFFGIVHLIEAQPG